MPMLAARPAPMAIEARRPVCQTTSIRAKTRPRIPLGTSRCTMVWYAIIPDDVLTP